MKRDIPVLVLVALMRVSAAEANHTKVYVANQGSNTVTVIDDQRVSAMTKARAGQTPAEDIARVADPSFAVVATIAVGANPIAIAMTTRFRRIFDERGADTGEMAAERDRLEQARSRAERRQISAGFAVAYALAAIFPLAIDLLRGQGFQGKSLVISIVFAAVAFASTIAWLASRRSAI